MNGIIGKYHKSNNLFDKNNPNVYFNTTIVLDESVWRSYDGNARVFRIPCETNTTYTISIDPNITTGVFRVMFISTNSIPVEGGAVDGDIKIFETYNVGHYTFTTSSNTKYVLFQTSISSYESTLTSLMFNKGSTALPYEPFGDIWDDMRCYKYGLLTDVFYAFPKQIIGDGNNISSYTIKGNMIQTGTPSTSNPVYPQECGDRTENLFDKDNPNVLDVYPSNMTMTYNDLCKMVYIPCKPNEQYTIVKMPSNSFTIFQFDQEPTYGSVAIAGLIWDSDEVTITTLPNTTFIGVFLYTPADDVSFEDIINSLMINEGSTALPYEPYGYKIPFSLNNIEYPIYLSEPIRKYDDYVDILSSNGNVSRKIKKIVLDGTEPWERSGSSQGTYYRMQISSTIYTYIADKIICSHCGYTQITTTTTGRGCDVINSSNQVDYLAFRLLDIASNESLFKTWLASEYANGTPVTVYIFYTTPVTETFTSPTIPTTGTSETFNVTTTLKPSEVDLSYHGWHKCRDIHKYKIIDRALTNLPDTIIGDGNNLDSYTIKGNMIQTGTPSTSNPVYPQECGDKTSNLISKIVQGGVSSTDGQVSTSANRVRTTPIYVNPGETYTANGGNLRVATYVYYKDGVYNSGAFIDQIGITIKIPNNVNQIIIGFKNFEGTDITPEDAQNVIFNKGSSVLPYEPYGYKIPFSLNNIEYPIYLSEPIRKYDDYVDILSSNGSVSRKIKKIVLTGDENWETQGALSQGTNQYFRLQTTFTDGTVGQVLCSHYISPVESISVNNTVEGVRIQDSSIVGRILIIRPPTYTTDTTNTFKQYLASEYANGTPVTIWYVLSTPTTETFTSPTIPTTGTSETFDISTTLKPSEVDLSYHSWYDIYPYGTIGYLQTTYTVGQMQQYPIDELQGGD